MIKKFVDKAVELDWSKIEEIRNIKSSCCIDSKVKVFDVDEFLTNFSKNHKFITDSSVDCLLLSIENDNHIYDLIEMKNWKETKDNYKAGKCCKKTKCPFDKKDVCPNEDCLNKVLNKKIDEFLYQLQGKFNGTLHSFNASCNINLFEINGKDKNFFRECLNRNLRHFILLVNYDYIERFSMTLKVLSNKTIFDFEKKCKSKIEDVNYFGLTKTPILMNEAEFTQKFSSNQIY